MIKLVKASAVIAVIALVTGAYMCYSNAHAVGATLDDISVRDLMASAIIGSRSNGSTVSPQLIKQAYKEADMVMEYRKANRK